MAWDKVRKSGGEDEVSAAALVMGKTLSKHKNPQPMTQEFFILSTSFEKTGNYR
jgi:hypothetical protein